jgi:predicted ribosomally synthesized peptide with SipW-like signal peptide
MTSIALLLIAAAVVGLLVVGIVLAVFTSREEGGRS